MSSAVECKFVLHALDVHGRLLFMCFTKVLFGDQLRHFLSPVETRLHAASAHLLARWCRFTSSASTPSMITSGKPNASTMREWVDLVSKDHPAIGDVALIRCKSRPKVLPLRQRMTPMRIV